MNEEEWLEIVEQMPPMGMTRILATHCHFGHFEDNKLGLHISVDDAHLATEPFIESLAVYMDEVFGRKTGLTIYHKDNEDLELLCSWKPNEYQALKTEIVH